MDVASKNLTIIGGVTLDVIFPDTPRLPGWPRHTEFTPQNLVLLRKPPIVTLGGNGGNAAYVAARCGAQVCLHSQIGDDPHGRMVRAWLEEAGCRLRTWPCTATPLNVTAANRRGGRATFFYAGEAPRLSQEELPIDGLLLICGWPHPPLAATVRYLAAARARGVSTALDAGPLLGTAWRRPALRRLLTGLDLFIANEHELKTLLEESRLARALRKLRDDFPGDVVIKRGRRGAIWMPHGSHESRTIPAMQVGVMNTVGAGDSFNGALMAARALGADFPEALRMASEVAASVVSSPQGVLGAKTDLGWSSGSGSVGGGFADK